MAGKILVSTAYLAPVEYFSLIANADEVFIEREENYLKQTYRNRCYILTAHGPQILSVPVLLGSIHKTPVKDIKIDYSKRWIQVHLRALIAAYNSSPFFEFYFESFEKIISKCYPYLLDLNIDLMVSVLSILQYKKKISYTTYFEPVLNGEDDYRYSISPKSKSSFDVKRIYTGFYPARSLRSAHEHSRSSF